MNAVQLAPVRIKVPCRGLQLELKRGDRGEWTAALFKVKEQDNKHQFLVFVCGRETDIPRFDAPQNASTALGGFEVWLRGTCLEVPEDSWHKLKAWFDQVTNATEGDNRGAAAGESQAGPDAAAGKPDAVHGVLQLTPHDDARPGLHQAGGRQAPPVQTGNPAGGP